MLDWRFVDKKKIAVFSLGLMALVGSVAVLGLTVQRIQNLKPTVTMPKASVIGSCGGSGSQYVGSCGGWGKCSGDCACGCGGYLPYPGGPTSKDCKSSFGNYVCSFDKAEDKCNTATKIDCSTKTNEFDCSWFGCTWSYSSACPNPYSPTYSAPWGQISGITPTFTWTWCDPSAIKWSTVYLWKCSPNTGGCNSAWAAADGGKTNLTLADFTIMGDTKKPVLDPNTQYWWSINPNSCASYPSVNCPVGIPPGIAAFISGSVDIAPAVPNCTNLTGPTTLTVGQKGTYAADFSSPQGNLGGEIFAGQNGTGIWYPGNKGISGNSGSLSFDWTPTAAGTYDVLCRAWNDGIAECRGKSNYVDAPPRYACAGPNSSMTVTVTAVAGCVTANCPDNQACVQPNNVCLPVICLPIPNQPCKNNVARNHVCQADNVADGTACTSAGAGSTCQSGVCTAPGCPTGQTACSGTCKNLQTDNSNCGACGNICASNQTCTSGTCANTSCTTDPDCSGGNVCAFP